MKFESPNREAKSEDTHNESYIRNFCALNKKIKREELYQISQKSKKHSSVINSFCNSPSIGPKTRLCSPSSIKPTATEIDIGLPMPSIGRQSMQEINTLKDIFNKIDSDMDGLVTIHEIIDFLVNVYHVLNVHDMEMHTLYMLSYYGKPTLQFYEFSEFIAKFAK